MMEGNEQKVAGGREFFACRSMFMYSSENTYENMGVIL